MNFDVMRHVRQINARNDAIANDLKNHTTLTPVDAADVEDDLDEALDYIQPLKEILSGHAHLHDESFTVIVAPVLVEKIEAALLHCQDLILEARKRAE